MAAFKRVACLYRVSTKKQLDENDIPMQRIACANFIKTKPLWQLEKEYVERGISGYNKSEEQRDILQDMKQDALHKKFDILLVFMFDRLGRREDESPFIVEWLVEQGIETWSINEGQQRFDNRTDKLINYIRFWQSGGESEKTSIRVYEKMKQMVEEGIYCGGPIAFGYKRVPTGEYNQKGQPLHKLVIDEIRAETIKTIFHLASAEKYNCGQIATFLNERRIPYKEGKEWSSQVLLFILRNPSYKGEYVFGRKKNTRNGKEKNSPENWIHAKEKLHHLIIIGEEEWKTANDILQRRNSNRKGAVRYESILLLKDLLLCGCCGSFMSVRTRGITSNQVTAGNQSYVCNKRLQKKCEAAGSYNGELTDKVVIDEIYNYLDTIKATSVQKKIQAQKYKVKKSLESKLAPIEIEIKKAAFELDRLSDEMIKCIMGESEFTSAQLTKITEQKENELSDLTHKKEELEIQLAEQLNDFANFETIHNSIPNWKKEFQKSDLLTKQTLISNLVDSVTIFHDKIEIHFKLDLYKISLAK